MSIGKDDVVIINMITGERVVGTVVEDLDDVYELTNICGVHVEMPNQNKTAVLNREEQHIKVGLVPFSIFSKPGFLIVTKKNISTISRPDDRLVEQYMSMFHHGLLLPNTPNIKPGVPGPDASIIELNT